LYLDIAVIVHLKCGPKIEINDHLEFVEVASILCRKALDCRCHAKSNRHRGSCKSRCNGLKSVVENVRAPFFKNSL